MTELIVAAALLGAAYYWTRVKQTDRRIELPPADPPQVLVNNDLVRGNPQPQSPAAGSTNVVFRRAAVVTSPDGVAKVSLT